MPCVFEVSVRPLFDLKALILFFQVEQPIVWTLAVLEINPNIQLTVPFVVGVSLLLLSTTTLLHCYRTLGRHFTYYLTIRDQHELVTSGLYNYVRHKLFSTRIMHFK
jgi:protein-S-isoprenylcysteine O-methyltransferase Ste14